MAVPNISEGRDLQLIADLVTAFETGGREAEIAESEHALAAHEPDASSGVRLLDVHSDPDHHRSVFSLSGPQGSLAAVLLAGAAVAVAEVDVVARSRASTHATEPEPVHPGQHPHVGALDVVPIVYLDESRRGAACAEALVVGDRLGDELGVPVFLYGELSGEAERTRADLRRGGLARLRERMAGSEPELVPDFGPRELHPTAGATLVAARPPLVAFNLQLAAPATLELARWIAARIREGGEEGLPGVRAIGVLLGGSAGAPVAQVSANVERPFDLPLAEVVKVVRRHAPIASLELVGLAPAAAVEGLPDDLPFTDFDPARHIIENALGS
jgi:glutamate formiminotransferase / 5-formyltetrahydrofolate cyclo-ligase